MFYGSRDCVHASVICSTGSWKREEPSRTRMFHGSGDVVHVHPASPESRMFHGSCEFLHHFEIGRSEKFSICMLLHGSCDIFHRVKSTDTTTERTFGGGSFGGESFGGESF